jgi:hypothetical protein
MVDTWAGWRERHLVGRKVGSLAKKRTAPTGSRSADRTVSTKVGSKAPWLVCYLAGQKAVLMASKRAAKSKTSTAPSWATTLAVTKVASTDATPAAQRAALWAGAKAASTVHIQVAEKAPKLDRTTAAQRVLARAGP